MKPALTTRSGSVRDDRLGQRGVPGGAVGMVARTRLDEGRHAGRARRGRGPRCRRGPRRPRRPRPGSRIGGRVEQRLQQRAGAGHQHHDPRRYGQLHPIGAARLRHARLLGLTATCGDRPQPRSRAGSPPLPAVRPLHASSHARRADSREPETRNSRGTDAQLAGRRAPYRAVVLAGRALCRRPLPRRGRLTACGARVGVGRFGGAGRPGGGTPSRRGGATAGRRAGGVDVDRLDGPGVAFRAGLGRGSSRRRLRRRRSSVRRPASRLRRRGRPLAGRRPPRRRPPARTPLARPSCLGLVPLDLVARRDPRVPTPAVVRPAGLARARAVRRHPRRPAHAVLRRASSGRRRSAHDRRRAADPQQRRGGDQLRPGTGPGRTGPRPAGRRPAGRAASRPSRPARPATTAARTRSAGTGRARRPPARPARPTSAGSAQHRGCPHRRDARGQRRQQRERRRRRPAPRRTARPWSRPPRTRRRPPSSARRPAAFGRYASASRVMPSASPNPGASARYAATIRGAPSTSATTSSTAARASEARQRERAAPHPGPQPAGLHVPLGRQAAGAPHPGQRRRAREQARPDHRRPRLGRHLGGARQQGAAQHRDGRVRARDRRQHRATVVPEPAAEPAQRPAGAQRDDGEQHRRRQQREHAERLAREHERDLVGGQPQRDGRGEGAVDGQPVARGQHDRRRSRHEQRVAGQHRAQGGGATGCAAARRRRTARDAPASAAGGVRCRGPGGREAAHPSSVAAGGTRTAQARRRVADGRPTTASRRPPRERPPLGARPPAGSALVRHPRDGAGPVVLAVLSGRRGLRRAASAARRDDLGGCVAAGRGRRRLDTRLGAVFGPGAQRAR